MGRWMNSQEAGEAGAQSSGGRESLGRVCVGWGVEVRQAGCNLLSPLPCTSPETLLSESAPGHVCHSWMQAELVAGIQLISHFFFFFWFSI